MRWLTNILYFGAMALLVAYLLNPGAGVFELIPDNAPVFGNLDEAAATAALIALFRRWRAGRRALVATENEETERAAAG